MLYTLDTNSVSQILNGQQTTLNHVRTALLAGDDVILNTICYYEIKRGLVLPTFQRKLQVFEQLVKKRGLLDLDKTALDEAITIYQDLRRKGTPLEDADLLMGAIAKANGATLVTHNTRHFQRIVGLSLVDWEI
jgi:tRNA(fMet)-specific endonuclease VapC